MEVGQHEEAAVDRHVHRDVGEEHAGHPTDEEVEEHPETEEHRGIEPYLRLPQRAERHQEEEPGRDGDELGREHEERPHVRVDAALEEVVLPDEERQQRHTEHARRRHLVGEEGLAGEHGHDLHHDPEARAAP